jgi:hypothetical protein
MLLLVFTAGNAEARNRRPNIQVQQNGGGGSQQVQASFGPFGKLRNLQVQQSGFGGGFIPAQQQILLQQRQFLFVPPPVCPIQSSSLVIVR